MTQFVEFDFEEYYGEDIWTACSYTRTIDELVDDLRNETSPPFFRNKFLAIMQLFFDGIVSLPPLADVETSKLRDVFGDLISAGRESICSFYKGEGAASEEIKAVLDAHSSAILGYSSRRIANIRHIAYWTDYILRWGLELEEFVKDTCFDTVVCVANGGFEPSFLIMEMAGIDDLIPLRFSNYNRHDDPDYEVKVPTILSEDYIEQAITNKKVLIVEDLVCSGESLLKVMQYVDSKGPSALYGTSVRINEYTTEGHFEGEIVSKYPFVCTL